MDEREESVSDSQLMADVNSREAEVKALLQKKDKLRALHASLQNPPIGAKSAEIKDANAAIVEKVIAALSDSELGPIVESLDLESCDILMKYLYRFMQRASNCPTVLKLHALVGDKAGVGSIVRVLTDRKQV